MELGEQEIAHVPLQGLISVECFDYRNEKPRLFAELEVIQCARVHYPLVPLPRSESQILLALILPHLQMISPLPAIVLTYLSRIDTRSSCFENPGDDHFFLFGSGLRLQVTPQCFVELDPLLPELENSRILADRIRFDRWNELPESERTLPGGNWRETGEIDFWAYLLGTANARNGAHLTLHRLEFVHDLSLGTEREIYKWLQARFLIINVNCIHRGMPLWEDYPELEPESESEKLGTKSDAAFQTRKVEVEIFAHWGANRGAKRVQTRRQKQHSRGLRRIKANRRLKTAEKFWHKRYFSGHHLQEILWEDWVELELGVDSRGKLLESAYGQTPVRHWRIRDKLRLLL